MHHFSEIASCLEWLAEHQAEQPGLDDIARQLQLSPTHAQRVFKRAVGLSPKQYVQALTAERSRALLEANASVLDAALHAGLSGPSRLHDLFVKVEAMTPGEYRRQGEGLHLRWDTRTTPLGEIVVCQTERGVAAVDFVTGTLEESLDSLTARWPRAGFQREAGVADALADALLDSSRRASVSLLLSGTAFQVQVWRALITVPEGARISYAQLAEAIGKPSSHRAVANAVAANSLAILIPCHRVIQASGAIGGYRWGRARKLALLAREQSGSWCSEGPRLAARVQR